LEQADRAGHDKLSTCRGLVRAGAVYDLIVVGPLAFPFLALRHLQVFAYLNESFGLRGSIPAFDPLHLLFANLFAVFVVIWALLRLFWFHPQYACADFASRFCVSLLLGWYAYAGAVNGIVNFFLVAEVGLAVMSWLAIRAGRATGSRKAPA
jgi:hypothetical protein